jgi:hypothetical protein
MTVSVSVHDLLAGVTWTPPSIEMEIDPVYEVEFDVAPVASTAGDD